MTVTNDGFLHFGDSVMLVHVGGGENRYLALNVNTDIHSLITTPVPGIKGPCGVTAGRAQACTRTTFVITSVDGSPEGSPLCYNQSFALKTTGFAAGFFLKSEAKSFQKCAKLSRLQDVYLDSDDSFLTRWKMVYFDPQERFENEGCPVPANVKVLIVHCRTNQALAALSNHVLWTLFGNEYEVTAHTFLDSHKAEEVQNHWLVYAPYPPEREPNPLTNALASADNEEPPTEKEILGAAGRPPPAGQ
ncbi:cilia- and flagella-associated protein 161 isoform X2 [Nelusetta ayraudi]